MKRIGRFEKIARVIGNAVAWCEYNQEPSLALTYADMADVLGMSKSTARRVARDMHELVDYARLEHSSIADRHVLVVQVANSVGYIDNELAAHYYDAYNTEMARLRALRGV